MQETTNPLNIWHKTVLENDPSGLYDILDDSFEFYSPAVFKSKEKYMGYIYLLAAGQSFLTSDFRYTRELVDEKQAVLEFRTEKALEAVKQEMTKHLSNPAVWR